MTQRHISHPEPLPDCAAGHSARHIHDLCELAAGGGHVVECRCRHTRKHAESDAAIAEWRRVNRQPRAARKTEAPAKADNVVQLLMPLREAGAAAAQRRAHARR